MPRGGSTACRTRTEPLRVGVISDTHGLLRPEALVALAGVDHIIHAGDVGRPGIVEALGRIAVVTAIRGNVDTGDWARAYPEETTVELAGRCILVLHDRNELRIDPQATGVEAVVSGHSHKAGIERDGGVLYLNPGAAGPRRFRLPATVALMEIGEGSIKAEIAHLAV